jgi:hypothetical protein
MNLNTKDIVNHTVLYRTVPQQTVYCSKINENKF